MKTKTLPALFLSLLALTSSPSMRADVISDWDKTGSDHLSQIGGDHFFRGLAMVHVAQFDAVNAVLGGYTPYAVNVVAPGASPEAAAAQAAYTVLTNITRASISRLNAALNRSLAAIPDGPAKEDGLRLGAHVASVIIQMRAADNVELSIRAVPSNLLGRWRTAPPSFTPGVAAQYRYLTPWTMRTESQFRPGPPPALTSAQYAADYEEVRVRGSRNYPDRTKLEAEGAEFHFAGSDAFLKPAVARRSLPLIESARVFALYYMVLADAQISFLEAQYAYSFWRPITAIRLGETDGNDATTADAAWNPHYETPPHPEYPSGTCTMTAAIIDVLISVYGDDFSFSAISENGPKPREFARLSAAVDDAVEARILAGAHYRNSCLTAVDVGRQIARNALRTFLRPVPNLASGVRLESGDFQLNLSTGPAMEFIVETSRDLIQWQPWHTNTYGVILQTDTTAAAADRRFYRILFLNP